MKSLTTQQIFYFQHLTNETVRWIDEDRGTVYWRAFHR